MANTTSPLTDTEIRQAKAKEKEYNLGDGKGLLLRIKPNGSKLWLFNYQRPYTKKRAVLSIGSYPEVSLKQARSARLKYRELLSQDIDPKDYKLEQEAKAKEAITNTFEHVANLWLESKRDTITENHFNKIKRSLEKDIFPGLGKQPVSKLKATSFITLLRPIEAKGSLETVKRLSQRINNVMNYAVNYGLIEANPAQAIGEVFKKPKKKHYPTLKPEQLPELMKALNTASIQLQTRCLIEWQLHTITRPSEASGAEWSEIDFKQKTWTIPAERMKKRIEHVIPLSNQAMKLLEIMKSISGKRKHIFSSTKNPRKPMSSSTANVALKRMGFDGVLVSHGLRALASTTLNEQGFDSDVIEACLAHIDKNEVRKAYNRATYLGRRTKVMTWWSDHIECASQGNLSLTGSQGLSLIK
ncbi:integrase domain-containing protein [Kangiella sediminilitoris]|uniref:Integrase n=1 Tax=Kangiella sediminilitoris TaxID=1144748 RepID=A0A1B3B905_9GAMM|nr:integrase domain-containing protein [Kangiella sediminilitoris]AOE49265.1 Integrase [Kangiella sediminilitoris]